MKVTADTEPTDRLSPKWMKIDDVGAKKPGEDEIK